MILAADGGGIDTIISTASGFILFDNVENLANGYELAIATLQTKDAETIGEDVILG